MELLWCSSHRKRLQQSWVWLALLHQCYNYVLVRSDISCKSQAEEVTAGVAAISHGRTGVRIFLHQLSESFSSLLLCLYHVTINKCQSIQSMLVSDAMQQLLLTFSGWQNVSSRALMVSAMDAHRRDALEDACSVFCSHTANERKRQKDAKREREGDSPEGKSGNLQQRKKHRRFAASPEMQKALRHDAVSNYVQSHAETLPHWHGVIAEPNTLEVIWWWHSQHQMPIAVRFSMCQRNLEYSGYHSDCYLPRLAKARLGS